MVLEIEFQVLKKAQIAISAQFNGARGGFPYEWGIEPAVRPKLRWTTEQVAKNND